MLARELLKEEDDFVTVLLNGREYIIDSIGNECSIMLIHLLHTNA